MDDQMYVYIKHIHTCNQHPGTRLHAKQCRAKQSEAMQGNVKPCNAMQSSTQRSKAMQSNAKQCNAT